MKKLADSIVNIFLTLGMFSCLTLALTTMIAIGWRSMVLLFVSLVGVAWCVFMLYVANAEGWGYK